jgi:hypothetical protein
MNLIIPEKIKSEIREIFYINHLPKNEWEHIVDYLFLIEITLRRMKAHKLLSKNLEKKLRLQMKQLTYYSCINNPRNKYEKNGIKTLCLNDYLNAMGFNKYINISVFQPKSLYNIKSKYN